MGFMDELKDKAEEFGDKAVEGFGSAKDKTEEVIENVKDRFDGDDDTPTLADESVGYSSEGADGIKEAVGEATESAGSAVDEAIGAQEAVADRMPGSESW
jgi:uncharacterized phage infection (PIP) family protein YhgE